MAMPMRYHAAGVTGRTDKKVGYRDAPASIKGFPENLNSYPSDFQAGQGLVWHGSKPVRHHRQNVSLHESHLQVDLLQLGHHVPRAKKKRSIIKGGFQQKYLTKRARHLK